MKILFLLLLIVSCKRENNKLFTSKNVIYLPLPEKVIAPKNNPITPEKIALGKLLFYDPILSGNRDVACATCHHPDNGYAEFKDISIGVNGIGLGFHRKFREKNTIPFVKRNAHTILNTAFNGIDEKGNYSPDAAPMFWDNRSESLEAQSLEPIKSLEEMRGETMAHKVALDSVITRLQNNAEYVKLFKKAFGNTSKISKENLGKAIATFERTLITPNSRFDQYLRGDSTAISISEKEGFESFKRVGCANCHSGPMFSDYKLHTLGMEENKKLKVADSGAVGKFKFRTPTLRNLRFTAPYMHNGNFTELKRVMEFYEEIAGGKTLNPNLTKADIDSLALNLTIRAKDFNPIISFINTLNDPNFDKEIPKSVPSGLPVGGNIN